MQHAPHPLARLGPECEIELEASPALANQVVPDVRRHVRSRGRRLARALDRLERNADLGFAGWRRDFLDRLPHAIAAQEIHLRVDAGRVAPQRVVDQADRLDVLPPVDRRAQAETGDGVGHRRLAGGLLLLFQAHHVFGAERSPGDMRFERELQRRAPRVVLAHAMQELHDERVVRIFGDRERGGGRRRIEPRDIGIGGTAGGAANHDLVGQPAQVLDQRELQHARPRPQLTERERRDALVGIQELRELPKIEPAVAIAQQFHRDRVDAGVAGAFARRQRGQLAVVAARHVLPDRDQFRRDEVEVIEEPLGSGGDKNAIPRVFGQGPVGTQQLTRVFAKARKDVPGAAARRIDREIGR